MSHQFSALFILAAAVACSPKPAPPSGPAPPPEPTERAAVKASPSAEPDAAPPAAKPRVEQKTLFVREVLADCEGESPRKCMQTRSTESEDWTYFYDSIEGFEYEASYRYELKVEVTTEPNPPADGSSLRFRLLEVVSKKKIP